MRGMNLCDFFLFARAVCLLLIVALGCLIVVALVNVAFNAMSFR